ncbi:ATP-binding cassette domain-containing protein [Litorivicinus lipolyticus]|uniref:Probable ATP-binding protein YheS n=1 Tax=Litorivicinus lipolyticus TaxID=418701 RepID=A0A5Q2QAR1_9GAMM|nr:ATP-binding cassette domain-containing protein [Litorivicinus lipolyticus]QGG79047.1 ATP-binding cassette domain-containing protein [Litorivicinus lipolyticus]
MLQLDSLTLRVGTRVLIDQQTLRTPHRARIGLIGHNGAGKSSLLRLIRGELSADSGHFGLAGKPVIASMAQETPALECSALDHLLDTNREFRELEKRMAEAPDDANLHTRFNDIEGWSQPAKAAELLAGLGFSQDRQAQPVSALSGGWRMRLNLARALFQASELLLLDEPTNHLDIDAITWLEKVLARYPGTLVLVAHDRAFLDSVCSHVLALDDQQLKLYTGGYSEFERQRAAEIERQSAEQAKTDRKRAHLQSFVDRFKAKASKAKQAQSRVKAMEKLVVSAAVRSRSPLNFNIPSSDKLSTPLVAGSDLTLGYPDADIVRGAHLSLNPGDRVGLLGVNGAGKSTLVKTLVGKLKPKSGTLHPGQNTKMGYFAQEQLDTLRADSVPLAELVRIAPNARELELRNFLGGWGFGADRIDQPITALSGGERARLALSLIAWQKPNLLILDEPTNHLDLDARAALAEALVEFPGALLLVSHDRHLLETTCDQLWSLRGGTLSVWTHALEDWVDDSPRQGSPSATSDNSQKEQRRNRAAQRTQLAPLRKALKSAEGEMEKLQVQLKRIDQSQAEPGYFTDTPLAQQTEDGQARARLLDALDDAEMVWLEASEALEDAS